MPPTEFILLFEHIVLPILGFGIAGLMAYGLYRVAYRYVELRHERQLAQTGAGASEPVQRLEARVDALEESQQRVQELEERLDFAERLLTQYADRERLSGRN